MNGKCVVVVALAAVMNFLAVGIAEVVTPVGVLATSEFGAVDVFGDGMLSDSFATDLIDGGGLMDLDETPDNILDDWHDNDASSVNGWTAGDFSAGLPGGVDGDGDPLTPPAVNEQALEFDLGGLFEVTHAHIWQQNQGPFFGPSLAPLRGVDEFRLLTSVQLDGEVSTLVGSFNLEAEPGTAEVPAQVIQFNEPFEARRIRFEIVSAFSEEDLEYVGLSEVRFEGTSLGDSTGDFNMNGELDAGDMDQLSQAIRAGDTSTIYDLNQDGAVDNRDRVTWVAELKGTWFGDADLNGEFDSSDFVRVFTAGQYEDDIALNSGWATGDWSGDGEFDSTDFVSAFVDGGFEQGLRPAMVPEPSGLVAAFLALICVTLHARRLSG